MRGCWIFDNKLCVVIFELSTRDTLINFGNLKLWNTYQNLNTSIDINTWNIISTLKSSGDLKIIKYSSEFTQGSIIKDIESIEHANVESASLCN